MVPNGDGPHCAWQGMTFVPPSEELPRANPSRGGDAKPGISPSRETARLPVPGCNRNTRETRVKANLGRFTTALALLATLALSLGAGARWY